LFQLIPSGVSLIILNFYRAPGWQTVVQHGTYIYDYIRKPFAPFYDWYDLLELDPSATRELIKKRLKKGYLDCHPDRHPCSPIYQLQHWHDIFYQLREAKETLLHPKGREIYDIEWQRRQTIQISFLVIDLTLDDAEVIDSTLGDTEVRGMIEWRHWMIERPKAPPETAGDQAGRTENQNEYTASDTEIFEYDSDGDMWMID